MKLHYIELSTPCSVSRDPCPGQSKVSHVAESRVIARLSKSWTLREMQTHVCTYPHKPVAYEQVWSSLFKLLPGEVMLFNKWATELSCWWRVTALKRQTKMETCAFVCGRHVPIQGFLCVCVCVLETFFKWHINSRLIAVRINSGVHLFWAVFYIIFLVQDALCI